jgi:hypothetical protein
MCKKYGLILFLLLTGCSNPDVVQLVANKGLLWQSCPAGQVLNKAECQGTAMTLPWDKALNYCAQLDMRLATRNELLNYYLQETPVSLNIANLYWTSSTDADKPALAWYLIPKLNWVYANLKELDGLVLCVISNKQSS